MDKIATNNLIVELRTDVKAAKAMVAGNLVRKINELKKALEKDNSDPAKKEKTEKKIEALHADIRMLKVIDPYLICKNAILKPDPRHWNDLIGDSKAPEDTKLMARVISKGRIQRQVAKFRSDHKDCDEWLEEYFEFREKKRELTEVKVAKRKTKQKNHKNKSPGESKSKTQGRRPNKDQRKPKQFDQRKGKESGGDHVGDNNKGNNRGHNKDRNRYQDGYQHGYKREDNPKPAQESLHPSWASKRREKEILRAALSGKTPQQPKRIILNSVQ